MEINRDVYLERLIVRKHNGFIKVITGIRRCGKSYLLNTLFYNHLKSENIPENGCNCIGYIYTNKSTKNS